MTFYILYITILPNLISSNVSFIYSTVYMYTNIKLVTLLTCTCTSIMAKQDATETYNPDCVCEHVCALSCTSEHVQTRPGMYIHVRDQSTCLDTGNQWQPIGTTTRVPTPRAHVTQIERHRSIGPGDRGTRYSY